MLTALILVVFTVVALVLILLAVVVVAIRQEPHDTEMGNMAPSLIAVMVRRLLGVYLRRPSPPAGSTDRREDWCRRPLHETVRQAGGGEKTLPAYTVEQVAQMLHVGRDRSITCSGPASCAVSRSASCAGSPSSSSPSSSPRSTTRARVRDV